MKKLVNILKEQKDSKLKGNLYHNIQILFSYNSNRIEGSQLSKEQTRYIFEAGSFEGKINVDDLIETVNHFHLFDYMLDTVYEPLTEELIKKYHEILKRSTTDEAKEWFNVGEYKALPNEVGGCITVPPDEVAKKIGQLLRWYHYKRFLTLEDIVHFHYLFESIHPFQDGNGRVGRLIMFKECLKNNITPFIIDERHKQYYYQGLREYTKNRGFLRETILSSQDRFIELQNKFLTEENIKRR